MPEMVSLPCWRVYGWNRGRWTVRSTHLTAEDANENAEALCYRERIPARVRQGTTRVAAASPARAPGAAQQFREQESDRMVIRRQAFAYFKSGCNGTELVDAGPEVL